MGGMRQFSRRDRNRARAGQGNDARRVRQHDKAIGYNVAVPESSIHWRITSMALIPIILSGGAGTRLWPLSREAAPKPFMPLPDGDTLLGKTALRAAALPGVAGLVTITNRDYYFHTKDVYSAAGIDLPRWTYLLEPFGRNT